jgi:hypothetical protein
MRRNRLVWVLALLLLVLGLAFGGQRRRRGGAPPSGSTPPGGSVVIPPPQNSSEFGATDLDPSAGRWSRDHVYLGSTPVAAVDRE